MSSEQKIPKELKTLFDFVDGDKIEIKLYGNDGFDNQEVLDGRDRLKKWILDAWTEKYAKRELLEFQSRCLAACVKHKGVNRGYWAGYNGAVNDIRKKIIEIGIQCERK